MNEMKERYDMRLKKRHVLKTERDTLRVTLKRAGPDTEQLKEERLPWRQRGRPTRGLENEKGTEGMNSCESRRVVGISVIPKLYLL